MRYRVFEEQFTRRALQHPLWKHPWFKLIETQPTLALLRVWAIQAGMIDEIFGRILTTLRNNPLVPNRAHGIIQRNIVDELGNGNPKAEHFQLFQGVLATVGVSLRTYRHAPALTGTRVILQGLQNAVAGDPVRALATMASEEFICPREFPRLMTALKRVRSGEPATWSPYFTVHCEADVGHSIDLLRELHMLCKNDRALRERARASQAEDLTWNVAFYDSLLLEAIRAGHLPP